MKKWLALTLAFTIFFSLPAFKTLSFAHDKIPDVSTSLQVEASQNKLYLSVYVMPLSEQKVKGLSFRINYDYSYAPDYFPFSYNADDTSLILDERFSDMLIANDTSINGVINLAWNTESNVPLSAEEEFLLARIPLQADTSIRDGEYIFSLVCTSFFCSEMNDETGGEEFIDMSVETPEEPLAIWYGEKLNADFNECNMVVSGQTHLPFILHLSKSIDITGCSFHDSSIAKISKIVISENGLGCDIYIIGKKAGATTLTINGGYNYNESIIVDINVFEPTPYMLSISKVPSKTTYALNEELDLNGLELEIQYDNYDVEYVPYSNATASDFIVDSYDFSTAGNKQIKLFYKDMYTYLNVTVGDSQSNVLRGDMNGDDAVTDADAIYLLYYTFFPNDYPLNQNGDYNKDEIVTDADAIYLLYHTFFPGDYPLD